MVGIVPGAMAWAVCLMLQTDPAPQYKFYFAGGGKAIAEHLLSPEVVPLFLVSPPVILESECVEVPEFHGHVEKSHEGLLALVVCQRVPHGLETGAEYLLSGLHQAVKLGRPLRAEILWFRC